MPTVETFDASDTWTAPAGVTSVFVECWGGGGSGDNSQRGGGGGAGAYASDTIAVTPSTNYTITVGGGGVGDSDGSPSWFSDVATVFAAGGKTPIGVPTGGVGGQAADSIGSAVFSGGNGGDGNAGTLDGGGGGGSALSTANGGAGIGTVGGDGEGDGGTGGFRFGPEATPGLAPGGGGGGRGSAGLGAAGAAGRVRLTYEAAATGETYNETGSGGLTIGGSAIVTLHRSGVFKFEKLAAWSPGMEAFDSFAGNH